MTPLTVPPGATLEVSYIAGVYPVAEAVKLTESVDVSGISRLNCPWAFVSVSLETCDEIPSPDTSADFTGLL